MQKPDKLTISMTCIAIAAGFLIGGPVWGFVCLVVGVIWLVAYVFHEPSDIVSLGDLSAPPARQLLYPNVDFNFRLVPATDGRLPQLFLGIHNRGVAEIMDIAMRATEYLVRNRVAIVTVHKAPADSMQIPKIEAGSPSQEIDILNMRFLLFDQPVDPAKRTPSAGIIEERYYALRFTFLDGALHKRFCFYKIIPTREPYLLMTESPYAYGYSTQPGVPQWATEQMLHAPRDLLIANQQTMYKAHPEELYDPRNASKPL